MLATYSRLKIEVREGLATTVNPKRRAGRIMTSNNVLSFLIR